MCEQEELAVVKAKLLTSKQRLPNDGKDVEQLAVRDLIKKTDRKVQDKRKQVCNLGNKILNLVIRKTVKLIAADEYGTEEETPGVWHRRGDSWLLPFPAHCDLLVLWS